MAAAPRAWPLDNPEGGFLERAVKVFKALQTEKLEFGENKAAREGAVAALALCAGRGR